MVLWRAIKGRLLKKSKPHDMKYFILLLLIGFLGFAGSGNRIKYFPINEIKTGQHLVNAEHKTFREFVEWRMYVTDKGWTPCDILLVTDSFIYYGYVVNTKAGVFSKVSTSEVRSQFLLSLTVDGDSVYSVARRFFPQEQQPSIRGGWYLDRPIVYKENGLQVKFLRRISAPVWYNGNREKILSDSILLSKTDLSVIPH
jgi:hypothetical protein